MLHRLYGSIHPYDRKAATKDREVTVLDRAPAYITLSMLMHTGSPCTPVVTVGDHVLLGQKIAEPTGLGAPIHASVSGTVTAIEPRPQPDGTSVTAIVIKNDFQNTPAPAPERHTDAETLTGWEVADLIAGAGIVGLGRSGFPTGIKLKDSIGKADTLIINGTECEPYLTADHRLILEEGKRILGGTRILMHALGLKHALIAVEANKMDGIRNLRTLLPEDNTIRIVTLKTRHPQGSEKQLIQKLTGRQVPSGKQPIDVNCVVFNVATTAAVYDAVTQGIPLTHRIVTVSGGAVCEPRNLLVPIGTPLEHLLEECGGLIRRPGRVLLGGPMTGLALENLDFSTLKSTNSLLFLSRQECSPAHAADPHCIRCGRCIKACPMNLSPLYFDMYARNGRYRELEKLHIMDCLECGSCAYSCPAHIDLLQSIRTAKAEIRCHIQPENELPKEPQTTCTVPTGKEDEQ